MNLFRIIVPPLLISAFNAMILSIFLYFCAYHFFYGMYATPSFFIVRYYLIVSIVTSIVSCYVFRNYFKSQYQFTLLVRAFIAGLLFFIISTFIADYHYQYHFNLYENPEGLGILILTTIVIPQRHIVIASIFLAIIVYLNGLWLRKSYKIE